MRSSKIKGIKKAEVCVIFRSLRGLDNSKYPSTTEFDNCFIIYLHIDLG